MAAFACGERGDSSRRFYAVVVGTSPEGVALAWICEETARSHGVVEAKASPD